jgi:hypothetical protein
LRVRKQYQSKISCGFAALENLNDGEDINRAWENIKGNIKTPAKERLWVYEVSCIIRSLKKSIYEFYIKGRRIKCSGYRIQTKAM